ncbi:acyl-CoA thioesterase [Oscillospiraceae bacterium OttesenSCG-928-G22]|nr:acyl-CoA thioesterase [Oscillospiraceae bacterium OttesenSCG-928-G22]
MNITPYIRKPHFYETDQMGVIYHGNYIRWFEEARVDFMDKMGFGYDRAEALGISFAVLHVSCDYKSMVRFGDTVQIETRITAFSAARMTVSYRITDAVTGELRTTGESRHCYVHREKGPISLKKHMPELYELFSANVIPAEE